MADRFLREIRDTHQLRKDIRSLPPAKAEEFMKRLGDDAADDWCFGRAVRSCRRPTYRGAGCFSVAAVPTSLTACRLESSINITQLPISGSAIGWLTQPLCRRP
jgi:hypothetical protein